MQSPGGLQSIEQQHADIRTLWVGDLQPWMDEKYLNSIFGSSGEPVRSKIIRNKTGGYLRCGFVEFASHECAQMMLQALAGTQMPRSQQLFRLNWAFSGAGERMGDWGPENSIFVGDLALGVTDCMLHETFRSRYSSVRGAKVMTDALTKRSRGYGFVRFGDEAERLRALVEMNGVYCSTRPMRISAATPRKHLLSALPPLPPKAFTPPYTAPLQNAPFDNDPNNTTVFVSGLEPGFPEAELQKLFGDYGEIAHVKIIPGRSCAFVQFNQRSCAEEALGKLQGTTIRQQALKLSWGRTSNNPRLYYGYGYNGPGYSGKSYASCSEYQG